MNRSRTWLRPSPAANPREGEAGKDLGIGTAQTFTRRRLIDEYVLTVHPGALGSGKPIFTGKTGLNSVRHSRVLRRH